MIMWRKNKIFKSSFVAALFLSGSISRSLFALTLIFSNYISLSSLDAVHVSIFIFNVATFFVSIIHNVF